MNLKEYAKNYRNIGWIPIPLKNKGKTPTIDWKPYQEKQTSFKEIEAWMWPNIGIITGQISGIIAFDVDGPEAEDFVKKQGGFPVTPQSKTSKGCHYILKYPDFKVSNSANKKLLLDVRGDGGYIVVPPSIHPSGHRYQWVDGLSPFDIDPAPLSPWMVQYIKDHSNGSAERIEIKSSPGDWEKAKREISSHSKIMLHLMTPKPGDRSGHDWRLACLCVEGGITDPGMLYQIILNNPHGKAQDYPGRASKYIEDLISKCLSQFKVENVEDRQFPREAVQGLAREYADTYSKYLESPWSFWVFAFLTCLGNILSDRLTIDSVIKPQPRLFTLLLGESADERKSECLKQTIGLFSEALPDFSPCFGVGSAEGLAERLNKHPKTVLIFDEMKLFVSKALIESSVLLPCVNTLFEIFSVDGKSPSLYLNCSL